VFLSVHAEMDAETWNLKNSVEVLRKECALIRKESCSVMHKIRPTMKMAYG
jgi:hypothetical protein